jgi:hypothetical protein
MSYAGEGCYAWARARRRGAGAAPGTRGGAGRAGRGPAVAAARRRGAGAQTRRRADAQTHRRADAQARRRAFVWRCGGRAGAARRSDAPAGRQALQGAGGAGGTGAIKEGVGARASGAWGGSRVGGMRGRGLQAAARLLDPSRRGQLGHAGRGGARREGSECVAPGMGRVGRQQGPRAAVAARWAAARRAKAAAAGEQLRLKAGLRRATHARLWRQKRRKAAYAAEGPRINTINTMNGQGRGESWALGRRWRAGVRAQGKEGSKRSDQVKLAGSEAGRGGVCRGAGSAGGPRVGRQAGRAAGRRVWQLAWGACLAGPGGRLGANEAKE